MTSSEEDTCSPTELLPLTMGRNQAFPVYSQWVFISIISGFMPYTHTRAQLFYTPGSLLLILHCQRLFSKPSMRIVLAAHKKRTVSEPPILISSHSSKQLHHTPYTHHICIYASNAPCELRRNVLMDQTIACDVQSTFCRFLNISLARSSVGSPAHYRMLITSHQMT